MKLLKVGNSIINPFMVEAITAAKGSFKDDEPEVTGVAILMLGAERPFFVPNLGDDEVAELVNKAMQETYTPPVPNGEGRDKKAEKPIKEATDAS